MTVDINRVLETGKRILRVKNEVERLERADKRIYELSRMLPDEEGYELVQIYKKSLNDVEKIKKVQYESKSNSVVSKK